MKNSMLWILLSVTFAITVAGVFFVLFPERFPGDRTFLVSLFLVASAAGSLLYNLMPGNTRKAGHGVVGSIGISTILIAVVFLTASAGVAMSIAGIEKGAMALDIVTVAGFVATMVVVRATASHTRNKPDSRSSQIVWADRLERIARECRMSQLKTRLLKLAGETRCLAHDEGLIATEVNQRISSVLNTVAEATRQGDEHGATIQLKRLRNLFAEREIELMNMRGRA